MTLVPGFGLSPLRSRTSSRPLLPVNPQRLIRYLPTMKPANASASGPRNRLGCYPPHWVYLGMDDQLSRLAREVQQVTSRLDDMSFRVATWETKQAVLEGKIDNLKETIELKLTMISGGIAQWNRIGFVLISALITGVTVAGIAWVVSGGMRPHPIQQAALTSPMPAMYVRRYDLDDDITMAGL